MKKTGKGSKQEREMLKQVLNYTTSRKWFFHLTASTHFHSLPYLTNLNFPPGSLKLDLNFTNMAIKHSNCHYLQSCLTLNNYRRVLTGLGHFWDTGVTMSSLSVVCASLISEACSQDPSSAREKAGVTELSQSTLSSWRRDLVPTSSTHCLVINSEYLDFGCIY